MLPAPVFDADRCVHELFVTDLSLRHELAAAFGSDVLDDAGSVRRERLRALAFGSDESRRILESLVHPRVRAAWLPSARAVRGEEALHFFDIPLLYETGAAVEFDRVVVVACGPENQRHRLRENRNLAPELIERMIEAQLGLSAKVARADHVIWNDGSTAWLDSQAQRFADYLLSIWKTQRM
jgi:dephospho-CoA kinase